MNGNPLTTEEFFIIRTLHEEGMTNREIAERIGRSVRTVQRITTNYTGARFRVENSIYWWLKEWWHWDVPEKKPPKEKKEHSWLITPYNYPRMWRTTEK